FQLEPEDRVLLYSDGVIEARNAEGEPFGVERLAEFLVRAQSSEEPAAETMRRLSKAILAHQGTPLEDDATLLSLQWRRVDI
ncbi:MAG: putative magnesium/manganese-dependent protein phosphatase, partial [Actinomycetia bacterium]|nr:putative magnesium/manganese-dependent protein phosphatase [Actinomycetes bacterium]